MLKAMGLVGTVISCSLSMSVFATNVSNKPQFQNFANDKVLIEAIHSQMAGKPNIEPIAPEKVEEVIQVARKQLKIYNIKSIKNGREYGGIIFEKNGVVQSTETVAGKKCNTTCGVNLDAQYNKLLQESKTEKIIIYADWHTHGPSSDIFSGPDREGMLGTMKILHERGHQFIGCFYGTPSGEHHLVTFDVTQKSMRRAFIQHPIGNDNEKDNLIKDENSRVAQVDNKHDSNSLSF